MSLTSGAFPHLSGMGLEEIMVGSYLYIVTDALWCLLMNRRWFSCVAPEIDLAFLPIQSEEAAGAHKDIDEVMANQSDLVKIVTALSPVAVIKG